MPISRMAQNLVRLAIVYGFGVALLLSNVYVMTRLAKIESRFAAVDNDLAKTRKGLSDVRTASEVGRQAAGRSINTIREELQHERAKAAEAVGEEKSGAAHRVEILAAELAARIHAEQEHRQEMQRHVSQELSRVTDAASQADQKIGEVKTEVNAVRSALAADRTRLEAAVMDLHRVRGDLGMQSGLIATNARELNTLKALGEKNYFDVELPLKQAKSIGGVSFILRRTDSKRLRFSVLVSSNDKRIEKKDRTLNEPVQFLVSKMKGPYQVQVDDLYELVINEVTKNGVKGYLATPNAGQQSTIASR